MTTIIVYTEDETPEEFRRWPALLRSLDDVEGRPRDDDGRENLHALGRVGFEFPAHTPVYVVADRAAAFAPFLEDFQHPSQAIYVFGPDHGKMMPPPGTLRVTIRLSRISNRCIHADAAAAMVMWSRFMQLGRWG